MQCVVMFESWDCREGKDCRRDGLIIKTVEGYRGRYDVSLPIPLSFHVIILLQHSIFISVLSFYVSRFLSA